jgi:AraC family transcriptional regulator of adaptative response/methylated-DNA-[protein]-cysteine methyltransferase
MLTATRPTTIHVREISTPLGAMLLGAVDAALCLSEFVDDKKPAEQRRALERRLQARLDNSLTVELLSLAEFQIREYFDAKRRTFELPLALRGTEFQLQVWRALSEIPYGQTRSYLDIARRISNPNAMRAVGMANGRNPLPLIVPCHRVVNADGRLGGFSAGPWRKQFLLELESRAAFQLT